MKRSKTLTKINYSSAVRRYRKVAAYAVLGLLLGVLIFSRIAIIIDNHRPDEVVETELSNESSEVSASVALPVSLRIPSIGIEADFEKPLGVGSNHEIEVTESYETVAYYKYGPVPGEIGPAVVLGHVDSYQGPAVLYSLGQVKVGEEIEIEREDGSVAVFVVESLERHEQAGFPTREVYSDLDYAGLRLITCTGVYNRGAQRYSHNLIVFAKLKEIRNNDQYSE